MVFNKKRRTMAKCSVPEMSPMGMKKKIFEVKSEEDEDDADFEENTEEEHDDDYEMDGDDDSDEDMPAPGRKIKLQNKVSKKSSLVNKEQQQQMVKPAQDNVVRGKKNQAVLGKQNSVALQGKKINDKGPSAMIIQRAGDEDDKDEDVEALKKAIMEKVINLKQNIRTKQPEGWTDKNKKNSTSKTQKTHGKHSLVLTGDLLKMQRERKQEKDSRFLFVEGIALKTKIEKIKALSSDILRIDLSKRIAEINGNQWCFVKFENKQKAIENHKLLQGVKIDGEEICVSFLVEKSCTWLNNTVVEVLKDKLICDCIPIGADMADIATLFPKSLSLFVCTNFDDRTAYARFRSAEDAEKAFKANENAKIHGKSVFVLYLPSLRGKEQIMKRKRESPFEAFGGKYKRRI